MNTIPNTGPINISSNNLENVSQNQTNRTIQNNAPVSSRAVSAMDMNINESKNASDTINSKLEDAKNDLKDEDKKVDDQNTKVVHKAFKFVAIILIIITIIVVITGYYFKWHSSYIYFLINSTIASLIFVAITETAFLLLIAKGYYSIDPNKLKKRIVDKLLQ